METTKDEQIAQNDLFQKAVVAVQAGLAATAAQYADMDKKTIEPNKTDVNLKQEG